MHYPKTFYLLQRDFHCFFPMQEPSMYDKEFAIFMLILCKNNACFHNSKDNSTFFLLILHVYVSISIGFVSSPSVTFN